MIKKVLFLIGALFVLSACSHTVAPEAGDMEETTNNVPAQEEVTVQQVFAVLKTNKGDITLELFPERVPITVANFLKLSGENFYDGVKFHRVIPDFMIQTGDPNSKDDDWSDDGRGGPGYMFADEVSPADQLVKGTVAMANSGPNTNGSQFFIVTAEATPWLNGKHTIFGRVTEGMDIVDAISKIERNNDQENHPIEDIVIEDVVTKSQAFPVTYSGQWSLAQFPKDYHYSVDFMLPSSWKFDCCGDTDSFSAHSVYHPSFTDSIAASPVITVYDFSLFGCSDGEYLSCSIDALQRVTADQFMSNLTKYLDKNGEVVGLSALKKTGTVTLNHFSSDAIVYQGNSSANQPVELYILESANGVVGIVFQQPENFDSRLKIEFLNRITPR